MPDAGDQVDPDIRRQLAAAVGLYGQRIGRSAVQNAPVRRENGSVVTALPGDRFLPYVFGMEDGSALAFFQFADPERCDLARRADRRIHAGPGFAEIDAARRADAHSELARWLSGDRRTDNELRGRAI
jgi:hypothetical protein